MPIYAYYKYVSLLALVFVFKEGCFNMLPKIIQLIMGASLLSVLTVVSAGDLGPNSDIFNSPASVDLQGYDLSADINQLGTYNTFSLDQSGQLNRFVASQSGSGNSIQATQSGRSNTMTAIQNGNGNTASLTQTGVGGNITLNQQGNQNQATINQGGNGNTISANQVGTNTVLNIFQKSSSSQPINVTVGGVGTKITIAQ